MIKWLKTFFLRNRVESKLFKVSYKSDTPWHWYVKKGGSLYAIGFNSNEADARVAMNKEVERARRGERV